MTANRTTQLLDLYPYHLRATPREMVWGGRKLEKLFGKVLPPSKLIGETWEAWDGLVIENGAHAGETLGALIARDAAAILGASMTKFPLLFKFIDAQDDLSVQVHPNDAQAQAMEHLLFGKTEAWYILQAEPNARLVFGFQRDVDRATIEASLRDKTLVSLLARVPVQTGDVIFVPAGTVHAIGKGIVLAEIQQNSDTTYRFYDWDRENKARPLHIEQSLAVTRFARITEPKIPALTIHHDAYDQTFLVACRYFALERWSVRARVALNTRARFQIIASIAGRAMIHTRGETFAIEQGETWVLPAQLGEYAIAPDDPRCELLAMRVPDLAREVIAPLAQAGFDRAQIARLGGVIPGHNDLQI
ncbi:MAG: class I mannose-6-phosphate isomerase [Chloroflexi bacterium]|nr:class I mannose-6-phosphate isomerase [Chloroflexota bacterium]